MFLTLDTYIMDIILRILTMFLGKHFVTMSLVRAINSGYLVNVFTYCSLGEVINCNLCYCYININYGNRHSQSKCCRIIREKAGVLLLH